MTLSASTDCVKKKKKRERQGETGRNEARPPSAEHDGWFFIASEKRLLKIAEGPRPRTVQPDSFFSLSLSLLFFFFFENRDT